jgi:protein-tyrosine phosphatase
VVASRGRRVAVIVDVHCHILHGLDDGPKHIDDSVRQAAAHVAAGTDTVVATPHVRPDLPDVDSQAIARATRALSDLLADRGAALTVLPGAEVDLQHACALDDDELAALHLGGGPWLLVEAPLRRSGKDAEVLLGLLRSRGHRLLLAHPERSPQFLRNPDLLRSVVADGARTQVTALALTGGFGSTVRRYARWMVEEQLAHVVASDAHDLRARPPGMHAPLAQAGFAELAPWLLEQGPQAILAGDDVPVPPAPKRGGLRLPRLRGPR